MPETVTPMLDREFAMPISEKLFDFAFCHASNYGYLVSLAAQENWGQGNSILINYLKHLYKRIAHLHNNVYEPAGKKNPYLYMEDGVACFDTGLYSRLVYQGL